MTEVKEEESEGGMMKRVRVPEGYLEGEVERVRRLRNRVVDAGKKQVVIDEVYEELVEVMKGGLVEVKVKESRRGQPWFTKEIAKLRKVFHGPQREWLNCGDKVTKRGKRKEYVENRRMYKKAVRKVKTRFEDDRQLKLEKLMRSLKKWWAEVKKLGLTSG